MAKLHRETVKVDKNPFAFSGKLIVDDDDAFTGTIEVKMKGTTEITPQVTPVKFDTSKSLMYNSRFGLTGPSP